MRYHTHTCSLPFLLDCIEKGCMNAVKKIKKLERDFQARLIKDLKQIFTGCIVLKLNPNHKQGIPDLLVLWGKQWAALECKRSANAHHQPNQEYYINRMNNMSFAKFIFPENKEDILYELEQTFGIRGKPRLPRSK